MKKSFFFVLLLVPFLFFGQQKRPTVGVVLSGGGAKGFAHVGILKALEKAGVQIDYIAGTSMGAIIGGLYASGYTADQIERIILETDFSSLLQDKTPRRSKTLFEKKSGEDFALVLPINKGRVGLPQAVSKGQNVLNFLTNLLSPVDSISDFSKLPIPFFCIGTDLATGDEVVFNKGSLALALRASGSFPTLLSPVEIDGKLLIDGGIANNFPVDEMRKRKVDIVIGVDVQRELNKKEDFNSVLDVLNQITTYQMRNSDRNQIPDADVYIHPKLDDFSVVSFDKSKNILKIGEEEAAKYSKTFDSIANLQGHPPKRTRLIQFNKQPKYLLSSIEINGNNNYTRAYILGALKISVNDSLSVKEITNKINYLSSTNNFKRIDFLLKTEPLGKKLVLNIKESSQKTTIKLALHYDQLYESSVLANYTHKNLLLKNDIFSTDFIIGDNPRYRLNYFVDNGFYYSYGFTSRYNQFSTPVHTPALVAGIPNVNQINVQYKDFTNTLYIQTTFDRKFAFGIGVEHKKVNFQTNTIVSNTDVPIVFDNSNYLTGISYLDIDTFDDKNFPTKGFYLDSKLTWYFWSSDYNHDFIPFTQFKGTLGVAKTIFNDFTFHFSTEAGFTFGQITARNFDYVLGGYNQNFINNFIPFYGYALGDLSDKTFLKSSFNFRYHLFKNHYLSLVANYARVEDNVLNGGNLFDNTKSGYALGYGIKTFLGPIQLKYSWSPDTNNHYWYFNLGFWF